MSVIRVYQPHDFLLQQISCLDKAASHHLARVLRVSVGDRLILFNGQGGEYEAIIQHINKKNVDVLITSFFDRNSESPLQIELAQGIARGEKMDFIVQKAVELGVNTIVPLITERSNVKWDRQREEKRLQHWQSVAISACEQSGRNKLPHIISPLSLNEWIKQADADLCLILSPHVNDGLPSHPLPRPAKIKLLIGPEGGFSPSEVEVAIAQGFSPWNLGPRVLRTETAPLAALSVLQYVYGDFQSK